MDIRCLDDSLERQYIVVEGMVQLDHIREPVSFPIVIKSDTGQVTVNAQ